MNVGLKIAVIVNPRAGGQPTRRAEEFARACAEVGLELPATEIYLTAGAGDATRIARDLVTALTDVITVSGGDGTINEVLQALAGTETRLACLPAGTANVLARELKLSGNPRDVAQLISRGSVKHVSVGLAEKEGWKRYFLLMAGIGLDARMITKVRPEIKRSLGIGAYLLAAAELLADWDPAAFRLKFNGGQEEVTFAVIANAASYAAWFTIAPGAELSSEVFNVCAFKTRHRLTYLWLAFLSLLGSHTRQTTAVYETAGAVVAEGPESIAVQLDGELAGGLPMRFSCIPDSLQIYCQTDGQFSTE